MATKFFNLTDLTPQPASAEVYYNLMQRVFDIMSLRVVLSATTTAQPGSPADEDAYILPASPTGTDWAGNGNKITFRLNGTWYFYGGTSAFEGTRFYVQDTDSEYFWDGSAWVEAAPLTGATGISGAGTTQGGATQLTRQVSFLTTITAGVNDAVKLLGASANRMQVVVNTTGATAQVFPASGDDIDGGATNAAVTLLAGKTRIFLARDATHWHSLLGA